MEFRPALDDPSEARAGTIAALFEVRKLQDVGSLLDHDLSGFPLDH